MRCVIIMYVIYTYSLWVYDVYIQAADRIDKYPSNVILTVLSF